MRYCASMELNYNELLKNSLLTEVKIHRMPAVRKDILSVNSCMVAVMH